MTSTWVTPVTLELPDGIARLEPLTLDHAPGLVDALGDGAIFRLMWVAAPLTIPSMRDFISAALDRARAGFEQPFAIVHRRDGCCVGSTRYVDIRAENRCLEIGGTWVGAAWQRTAVNTECKLLLLRHAFESLNALRVQLKTDSRNVQSQEAIARIGAKYEGTLRGHMVLHDGYVRSSMMYSVLAKEWPDVRTRLESRLIRGT